MLADEPHICVSANIDKYENCHLISCKRDKERSSLSRETAVT